MARSRRAGKVDVTGRNKTSRFARLDHSLLNSGAYRSLTPNARCLLTELTSLENGSNNGSIYLSVQDAADRMGVSDHHAASNAFDELQARGFIEKTADAHFAVKTGEKSRARTWRLAWLPGPGRKAPQWDFSEPEPATKEHRRMERGLKALKRYRKGASQNRFPVVDSSMLDANATELTVEPVVGSTTLCAQNGEKPPFPFVVESPHHSAATMGSAATAKFGLN